MLDDLTNNWLDKLSYDAKSKIWDVVDVLKLELELRGRTTFKIPLPRFDQRGIDRNDLEAILINLDEKNVISINLVLNRTPQEAAMQMTISKSVHNDPSILWSPNTDLEIFQEEFKEVFNYLKKEFKALDILRLSDSAKSLMIFVLEKIIEADDITPLSKPRAYRYSHRDINVEVAGLEKMEEVGVVKILKEPQAQGYEYLRVNRDRAEQLNSVLRGEQSFNDIRDELEVINYRPQEGTTQTKEFANTTWPKDYGWQDDLNFQLGEGRVLDFTDVTKQRYRVFKPLADAEGKFVYISEISNNTGIKPDTIRQIISQIEDRIESKPELKGRLTIESKGDRDKGAYRLVPHTS